jgi:hypothetical protein
MGNEAPHHKTALILWNAPKSRRTLFKVVAATGARVEFVHTEQGLPPIDDTYSLIIVDYDSASESAEALFATLAQKQKPPPVLAVTSGEDRPHLARLLSHNVLTNLFVKNIDIHATELIVTVQKLLLGDVFGLEKYLAWGAVPREADVTSSRQKPELLRAVSDYLHEIGCNSRLAHLAQNVADELLMNALYNAPLDSAGSPKYARLDRSQTVSLLPHEAAHFRYASDGRNLAISVADPFGHLSRDTVLRYLRKCFLGGETQIDDKDGGSGLGFYYIFESLNYFVINVAPSRCTETIGIMDISGSYRDFAERPKSIHVFYDKGESP